MKKLIFLLFIIIISCSKEDIITDDNNIKDDEKDNPIKQDTTTTTSPSSSFNVIGQWVFNTVQSGGINIEGSNIRSDNHLEGDSLSCSIHSIIFKADSSFNLYTGNYVLFGNYNVLLDTTEQDTIKTISLFIGNTEIGKITDAETDTTFLEGSFEFPELCVKLQEGYQDSVYTEGLTYIPDDIFEQYLIDQGYDDYMDDYMISSNVAFVSSIGVESYDICQVENCDYDEFYDFDNRFEKRMTNLSGIEAFQSLIHINIIGHKVDSINLTQNWQLRNLYANFNEFKSINTDKNLELRIISIDDNIPDWSEDDLDNPGDTITKLDFTYNTKLQHISVPSLGLFNLDISNNPYLEGLSAGNNRLSSIDFSSNMGVMETIKLGGNNLTEIDVTKFDSLRVFSVPDNKIKSIDLSNNPLLEELSISGNPVDGILDVSFMPNLKELYIGGTNLTCVKLSEDQLTKYEAGEYERWSLGSIPYSLNCN